MGSVQSSYFHRYAWLVILCLGLEIEQKLQCNHEKYTTSDFTYNPNSLIIMYKNYKIRIYNPIKIQFKKVLRSTNCVYLQNFGGYHNLQKNFLAWIE